MALKLKKDVKKSSYYVWFLGAKESKGLRGNEYISPIIENLEEREKDIEPFKVTLQVSHKGLKIVQNVISQNGKSKPKNETIKHFIPHNTITCVHQKDDIIACILLLFNPVTKCPLHVHAYRCDSLETASMLKGQLQLLIERPENQKKFAEIENRLARPAKEAKKFDSSLGSDTGTSTRESESSDERFSNSDQTPSRVATLYDSVAAELRAKLNKNDVPILLPPRDYDTVHRQKGNLTGIELRRCLNTNIVGQNVKARRIESSGGSSGIGSDHAPSPDSPDGVNERFHGIDGHSTSDDEWNADNDTSLYLMDTPATLHRQQGREKTSAADPSPKYDYRAEQRKPRQFDQKISRQHLEEHIKKQLAMRTQLEEKYRFEEERFLERERYHQEQLLQSQPVASRRVGAEKSRMEMYQDEGVNNKRMSRYEEEEEIPVPKVRSKYTQDRKYHEEGGRKFSESPVESSRKYEEMGRKYREFKDDGSPRKFREEDSMKKFREEESMKQFRDEESMKKFREEESMKKFREEDSMKKFREEDSMKKFREEDSMKKYREEDSMKKFREEDSMKKFREEDSMKKFREEESMKKYREEDSMKKFRDEECMRKFRDEEPARKFRDEEPSRKFRDEETARKFRRDDESPRKLRDEESARKFRDEERARKYKDEERAGKYKDEERARKFRDEDSSRKFNRDEDSSRKFNRDEESSRKFNRDDDSTRKFRDEEATRNFLDESPRKYREEASRKYAREDEANRKYRAEDDASRKYAREEEASRKHRGDEEHARNFEDPIRKFEDPSRKYPNERKYREEDVLREQKVSPRKYVREEEKSSRNYRNLEESLKKMQRYSEETLKKRTPSPRSFEEVKVSPRDRFKDAKEKFLLLERERLEQEIKVRKGFYADERIGWDVKELKRNLREEPIEPVHVIKSDRYYDEVPKPAPRSLHATGEDVRLRYKSDPKRRSMFNLASSEDHKKNSQEIARELKRRSYYDYNAEDFFAAEEQLRYDQKFLKNPKNGSSPGGYRNSYAEPKYRGGSDSNNKKLEVLHRTNSTVSNNGRVGIASVHPY